MKKLNFLAAVFFLMTVQSLGSPRLSGETMLWHRVTLTFDGPESSEKASPNPFLDFRLDVTFSHPASGDSRIVPGFFAADGHSAETSADRGSAWRVHFSPHLTGEWRWRVSFRSGPGVAVAESTDSGEAWLPLDGTRGSFVVGVSDKAAPDFRASGHLEYAGERYLRFSGNGRRFLKGGVGSPETLLGYADFDGTWRDLSEHNRPPAPNPPIPLPALENGLLRFGPHLSDWREGDPSWQEGKGKGLIGGLNYLAAQGVNSVYFLTMNVNGDGRNVWPWIDPWVRDRFDCSKLDQWEIVFSHMTRLGIMLHIVTQETENDHLLDRGGLGKERKLYYRELVARFSHHPAITWNLGEENVQGSERLKECLEGLRGLLPYRQHLVVHNDHWHARNLRETFDPFLGVEWPLVSSPWSASRGYPGNPPPIPLLTGLAVQDFHWPDVHTHVRHYVQRSAAVGLPWVVSGDELGGANFGTLPDAEDPNHDAPRRFGLWGSLMAGGAGVEWYFGWQNNSPFSDLSCQDWRTREEMYRQTRIALDFFHEHLPFWRMNSADESVVGHGAFGLFAPGEIYAVYLPAGGGTRFDLGPAAGFYEVKWFNPRSGGDLVDGPTRWVRGPGLAWTGFPPSDPEQDWLALIRRLPDPAPSLTRHPDADWQVMRPEELGLDPVGLNHALNYWRMHTGPEGVSRVVVVRRGVVAHAGREAASALDVTPFSGFFQSLTRGIWAAEGTGVAAGDDTGPGWARTFHERLLSPLGIVRTGVGAEDQVPPNSSLQMSALDVARLGLLGLTEGRWENRQILTWEWIRSTLNAESVSLSGSTVEKPAGSDELDTAWVVEDPYGSVLVVLPAWDMVIVRLDSDQDPPGDRHTVLARFLNRLGLAVHPLDVGGIGQGDGEPTIP